MKSITTSTLLWLLAAAASSVAQEEVPDDVLWTGLADFGRRVRYSDVDQEFGTTLSTAEPFYNAATIFEWRRALADNESRSFPYLLCKERSTTDDQDSFTGYQLKTVLQASLAGDDGDDTTNTTIIKTMVNRDDLYCAVARMRAVTAIVIARTGWKVQPLLSSMKLMPDSIAEIERRLADDNDDDEEDMPSLDIILCPQVEATEDVTTQSSATISDSTLRDSLAWWRNNTIDNLGPTPRQEFWERVLTDGVENGACTDTVANRLIWNYFPSSSSNNNNIAESTISLTFNHSDATTVDKLCALAVLASLIVSPQVCTVETRKPQQTRNRNAQWLVQTGIDSNRPWFDAGIMGSGQIVAVSDTGIDVNNCYFADEEDPGRFRNDNHRKIVQYIPFADNVDQQYGHGTHVVGTVLASRDENNPTSGMVPGIAPEAKVAFLDIGKPNGALTTPSSDFAICETGRDADPKAKVHSASWGLVGVPSYTIQTRNFDQYMFDNDDFLMVIAAGNDGDDDKPFSVSSPATAKNIISVGASHSCCGDLETGQLGPDHIASFSSRGPTADGRTKPDVVAPGKWILSVGARPDSPGSCDPSKAPDAGGKSGGVLSLQGTSMATPVVSGSAALVRQYFEDGFYPTGEKVAANAMADPSGALIKAVLMNGAQYLDSVDNGRKTTTVSPYDNTQNFGRISFIDSLYLKGKSNVQAQVWDRQIVNAGAAQEYTVTIDKSNGCTEDTISVSLIWMEEGSFPGCANCVLNDLDLSITKQGDKEIVYYPNGRDNPDDVNNAERVQIGGVSDEQTFIIRVHARNIQSATQQFALVATACLGGVANTLETSQNAFDNDTSEQDQKNTIIIVVCSVVGGLLLLCGVGYFLKKRREKTDMEEYGGGDEKDYEGEEEHKD